ncbi:MAG: TetR family transcriptional regulator [Kiloniellaceae bacterium]
MVKKADIPNHIIDTAMKLAAEKGWRDLSLAEIAEAAKLPLSKVYPVFDSKAAILEAFSRRIDAEVLAAEEPGAREGSARDRLFDVLMRRFDALGDYRQAVGNIVCDIGRDPLIGLCAASQFRRTLACMLEAADLSASGLRGAVRIKGLGLVYLATLRVWLTDDSPDMARTMAALDRHLRRLEWLAGCCSRARQGRPRASQNAA